MPREPGKICVAFDELTRKSQNLFLPHALGQTQGFSQPGSKGKGAEADLSMEGVSKLLGHL